MLHIITRYTNESELALEACYDSIIKHLNPHLKEWDWFLVGKGVTYVFDLLFRDPVHPVRRIESPACPDKDWGMLLNLYLDCIPDRGQWFYILDADNLLHPNFPCVFERVHKDASMVVVAQEWAPDAIREAKSDSLVVQKVDIAQAIFRRSFVGQLRAWSIYRNDGYFIQELAIRAREYGMEVQCIDEVASYWNRQQWKIGSTSLPSSTPALTERPC